MQIARHALLEFIFSSSSIFILQFNHTLRYINFLLFVFNMYDTVNNNLHRDSKLMNV